MPFFPSLPNLHPAVVHFPIALIPVAALMDLAGLIARSKRWLDRAATTVWALAAVGAAGAYWAGRHAADSLTGVPPRAQPAIAEHSDWAWWTLWAVVLLAVVRIFLTLRENGSEKIHLLPVRWLVWLGGVGCVILVSFTADLGGGLVYRHQVAVGTSEAADRDPAVAETPQSPESPEAVSPRDRWTEDEEGTWVWRPRSGDAEALGSVLTAADGSSLDPVTAASGSNGAGSSEAGLTLQVDGRAVLLLPEVWGDVQVEADLDLSGFDGTAGVAHHVAGASQLGAFTVASTGEARLLDVEDGENELATASVAPSGDPVTLAVSAVGGHLKGFVDGEQVTHGHIGEDPEGGVGLLLDGRGEIRVLEMRVIPLG